MESFIIPMTREECGVIEGIMGEYERKYKFIQLFWVARGEYSGVEVCRRPVDGLEPWDIVFRTMKWMCLRERVLGLMSSGRRLTFKTVFEGIEY